MPIPYAIDPSLHHGPPVCSGVGDGFSPPPRPARGGWRAATIPIEPEPPQPMPDDAEPNTSRLPVEPEFAPEWRPAEPEDPGAKPRLP
ncbi:hypothetical protein ACT80S_05190 [Ramlibacter sp. MAHUQ-53]|uniref:hypothetical protein n=1 Tax=unclassified Ramlibacter TaxID=2617605 RepID=UPI00362E06CA